MGLFPQQFIDDLRLQANILQVVQEYVPLKRAGTSYKGLCPFHNEKTPSFNVNPEKGFFHCFGCGVGGDVFKFLELHEKVGFQDAVRMLAQKFGVALPEPAEGDGGDDARRDSALREGAAQGARDRGGVLHGAAGGAGRRARARAAGRARRHAADDRAARPRLRPQVARRPEAAAAETGLRAGRITAERPDRAARERRGGRSVPQPADGADLPRHRVGHRVRRPSDGCRTRAGRNI